MAYRENYIRLNKWISHAGICSRRKADSLIENGKIRVNGQTVTTLGYRVRPTDLVSFGDKALQASKKVYVLFNKPKNCLTTLHDPEGRRTVLDLVAKACPERLFPVGRLDRNTTGLLLLTNDGDLAQKLAHPSYQIKKVYQVELAQPIQEKDVVAIKKGVKLVDGLVEVDDIAVLSDDGTRLGIEIHSGRNRVVRRLFENLGYRVTVLDRVLYANLTKKNLPRGQWRYLESIEVNYLKYRL